MGHHRMQKWATRNGLLGSPKGLQVERAVRQVRSRRNRAVPLPRRWGLPARCRLPRHARRPATGMAKTAPGRGAPGADAPLTLRRHVAITAAASPTRPAAVEAAAAALGLSVRLGAFDSDQYSSGGRTGPFRQVYPSRPPGGVVAGRACKAAPFRSIGLCKIDRGGKSSAKTSRSRAIKASTSD
jgi:hypothetical protein